MRQTILKGGFLLATACGLATSLAAAQSPVYPVRPIRMVIALAPGGGTDTTGRFLAQKLSEALGQPVVADNRPGAGGTLAAEIVAHAPPDGYTLLMTSAGISITPSIMKLDYDPRKDLMPVSLAVISPGVMVVHPSLPVKNVKELIAFAKSRPSTLLYSSSGQGSGQHLAMELFCQMTGLKMTHIPFKGTAPSVTDVVAGRIALTIASVISTQPMFSTGRLRAIAVVGEKRTPALPDLPTIAESGVPGYSVENWYGLFVTGGTSREIAAKLAVPVERAVKDPSASRMLIGQGLDPVGSTPDEFSKMYLDEIDKWAKVAKTIGLQAN